MRVPRLPKVAGFRHPFAREGFPPSRTAPESGVKLEKVFRLCRKKRRGAVVVEFAVIAPLFFLLIFGMIEIGRMVMVQQVITNASREGARVAVLDGTSGSEVLNAVDNYLGIARVSGADITVDPAEPSSAGYGEPVTVTVSVPFGQVTWLPSPMLVDGDTELTATTVMRRETAQ